MEIREKEVSSLYRARSGQTSIFIILALVVLAAGSLVFYLDLAETDAGLASLFSQTFEQVPTEAQPVKSYVEQCLATTAEDAIRRIGNNGGYLSVTDPDLSVASFSVGTDPTESDAVQMTQTGEISLPYWWHLKSPNGCTGQCEMASERPSLTGQSAESIQSQITSRVSAEFSGCIQDFAPLRAQGYDITERGQPRILVEIAEDDVSVAAEYPLTIGKDGSEHELEQFLSTLNVDLKSIYDLASHVTNLEMEYRFLEKHTLSLLVAFSGVDGSRLPPMSELRFEVGGGERWSKQDVRNKVTGMITSHTPLFKVENTRNFYRPTFDSPLKQRLYDATLIPSDEDRFENLDASFSYLPQWPVYFDLNCEGDSCKSNSASSAFSGLDFLGIQQYDFAYDISYPVMIELSDPSAFNGKGYTFRFALEANIRNNEPMPADFRPLEQAALGGSSLLCDRGSWSGQNTTVTVVSDGEPVQGAQVLFSVVDTACPLGVTGEDGTLTSPMPRGAVGATLEVSAFGHVSEAIEFNPAEGGSSFTVEIPGVVERDLVVMKKRVVTEDGVPNFQNIARPLGPDEEAVVSLTRVQEDGSGGHTAVAQFRANGTERQTIRLAPGTYEADITLLLHDRVYIPAQEECARSGFFGEEECFETPAVDFGEGQDNPVYMLGGLKTQITIPANELRDSSEVTLFAITSGVPQTYEDLQGQQTPEELSQTYRTALQPEFK